ncbi:MAG: hypothetical protein C4570_07185 [Ammonifex sp.]|nr:MAG: hypothetical protein C4570_07185 [Ammonifex sp.]
MDIEELAAIRARAEATLDLPLETQFPGTLGNVNVFPHGRQHELFITVRRGGWNGVPPEGRFFANARQDVLDLCAEVARLRDALESCVNELDVAAGYIRAVARFTASSGDALTAQAASAALSKGRRALQGKEPDENN